MLHAKRDRTAYVLHFCDLIRFALFHDYFEWK